MKLSVIIPALNEAAGIEAAIGRAWDLAPCEVIVVDGGSSDATVQTARQCQCILLESPRGRAVQQNLGSQHAQGDVLLFLHADTWLDAAGIEQIEAAFADPKVVSGAFRQCIDAPGMRYRCLERGNALRVQLRGLPYGDQGIVIRRETFERMGRFPEVRLLEDWLFMRQLRRSAWPVLMPGPLHVSARRWQKHGVLRQTLRNWSILAAASLGVSPDRLADYYSAR